MTHFDHFENEMEGFDYLNNVGLSLKYLSHYDGNHVLSQRVKQKQ